MVIIRGLWNLFRGMSLVTILVVLFAGVILVSCLARLLYGAEFTDVARKLRLGC